MASWTRAAPTFAKARLGWAPLNSEGPASAMIASAKASSTSGFIGVSRETPSTSAVAPARPLLNCSWTPQCRLAANQASTNRAWFAGWSRLAGSQADVKACQKKPTWRASPDHQKSPGVAPARVSRRMSPGGFTTGFQYNRAGKVTAKKESCP